MKRLILSALLVLGVGATVATAGPASANTCKTVMVVYPGGLIPHPTTICYTSTPGCVPGRPC